MTAAASTLDRLLAGEADPVFARRVRTVLGWLPPDPDPRNVYVDVGCGRGYYLHYYAALGQGRVVGIERDRRIAELARRALANEPAAQVTVGSATALPLTGASVAGIVMSEVLEHVEDDAAALREAARVLRPGGSVALTVPHGLYPWLWDPVNRTRGRRRWCVGRVLHARNRAAELISWAAARGSRLCSAVRDTAPRELGPPSLASVVNSVPRRITACAATWRG